MKLSGRYILREIAGRGVLAPSNVHDGSVRAKSGALQAITLSGNSLTLTAKTEPTDTISIATLSGITDEDVLKEFLDPEDDAAHVSWGGSWRMPSYSEMHALYEICSGESYVSSGMELTALPSANPGQDIYYVSAEQTLIAEYTGVSGTLFCDGTNKLFFPSAGSGYSTNYYYEGSTGMYWTNTTYGDSASPIRLDDNKLAFNSFYYRYYGFSVRAISD